MKQKEQKIFKVNSIRIGLTSSNVLINFALDFISKFYIKINPMILLYLN